MNVNTKPQRGFKLEPVHPKPEEAHTMPYAPAVHIVGACDLMFLSGATPSPLYHKHPHVDAEHVHPHSIEEQTTRAMEAIKSILDHTGATWRDVVKVTKYLTDFREADAMHADHGEIFRRLAAGLDHGVHQPVVVAGRAHRARHDRGAAEEGLRDASAASRAHRRGRNPALFRRRDGAPARGGGGAARRARLRSSRYFAALNRFGSAVQWLTQWPVTAEAVGVFTPGRSATRCSCNGSITRRRRAASPTRRTWPGAANRRSPRRSRCWTSAARAAAASPISGR